MKMKIAMIIFMIVSSLTGSQEAVLGNDVETRLMKYLFEKQHKMARPSYNKSTPVNMTFGLAYVQLIQLDDRSQTLISNVWIRQTWYNHMLRWDPKDFDNVTLINIDPKLIWLPDVVLYNNAKNAPGAGIMYQFKTKVKVHFSGTNTWYAPSIIRSSCNIDVSFFPFDDQYCELQFGSWTYSGLELNIYQDRDSADLSFYLTSAEFNLISAKAERKVFHYSCCPDTPYPNVIFTIHLRRQPGFFLFNVIIPSMVITFFAILTFSSPPSVGERISLAIESFLSLSFLCMMVADSIPVNSDVSPLITQFLIMCMVLISAALLCNLISMNLNSNKPVPKWLKVVALDFLGPCVGYFKPSDLGRSKLRRFYTRLECDNSKHCNSVTSKLQNVILERFGLVENGMKYEKHALLTVKPNNYPRDVSKHEYNTAIDNMNDILDRSAYEFNQGRNKEFWRCIAQTVDRLCMIAFSVSFVFVSAVMLFKGYGHQIKVQSKSY